jgi:hypothetical protein
MTLRAGSTATGGEIAATLAMACQVQPAAGS